jgi:hypothetical protein
LGYSASFAFAADVAMLARIEQSLRLGIIDGTEAEVLRDYDAKVLELINVDDFAPHELGVDANQRQ